MHMQQYKNCWTRLFRCGPCRIKESRRLVLPRTSCLMKTSKLQTLVILFSCSSVWPSVQCTGGHRIVTLIYTQWSTFMAALWSSEAWTTLPPYMTHLRISEVGITLCPIQSGVFTYRCRIKRFPLQQRILILQKIASVFGVIVQHPSWKLSSCSAEEISSLYGTRTSLPCHQIPPLEHAPS
jgi:hypothetical protein